MTDAQDKKLYWPCWAAACRANAWRMQAGCLTLAENPPEPANTVIAAARVLAEQEHRAVMVDDLRHASHYVACNRHCSHKKMTSRELSRWKWLMALLEDPDDLEAMMHWQNPSLDTRQWREKTISRVPEAYVTEVCRRRFDGRAWRALSDDDLRSLFIILAKASDNFRRPLGEVVAA